MSWEKVNLGDLATFVNGYPFKPSDWSDEGMEIIRIQNLTKGSAETNYYKGQIPEKYKIKNGDILISWSATLDIFVWAGKDAWLNQHIFKVVFDKKEIDRNFFVYLIKFILDDMRKEVHGATMQHITKGKFDALQVPLPPLPIQKRIAEILDAADALRRKDQELLSKYDELAQAIFIDMFGDPVKNEKGWEVKKLKEFGKVQTGNTPPREEKRFYGSFIEWIKTDNILLEKLNPLQATEYLSEEGLKKGRYVDSGSVLVTCIAGSSKSIGNVVLTNRRVSFNQQINSLTPKSSYNKLFIYALFRYSKSIIQDNTTQGMKRIITKSTFENLKFISPPIELQNEFEQKYKVLLKLIDSINFQQKSSENLFDSLLQQAFKGELVK